MEEVWKKIKGLENYLISNYGRVKGLPIKTKFGKRFKLFPERILKPSVSKIGYNYIITTENGIRFKSSIHRLVAEAFIENDKKMPQVNHIDANKSNNLYSNLEWCTAKHNLKHARDLGLNKSIGSDNKMAKLKPCDILEIRKSNKSFTELAFIYNVSNATISNIRNFKTYQNIK